MEQQGTNIKMKYVYNFQYEMKYKFAIFKIVHFLSSAKSSLYYFIFIFFLSILF